MQTARSLLKGLASTREGAKLQGNSAYLQHAEQEMVARSPVASGEEWRQPSVLIAALRCCTSPAETL